MYPKRRNSLRCKGFDYSSSVGYHITICTHQKRHFFGEQNPSLEISLSPAGQMVEQCLKEIPLHFPYVEVDFWAVMPNHAHFILILRQKSCAGPTTKVPANDSKNTLSRIVGSFKSACTFHIRRRGLIEGPVWQRSFHDRIILKETELGAVRQYIVDNPVAWRLEL